MLTTKERLFNQDNYVICSTYGYVSFRTSPSIRPVNVYGRPNVLRQTYVSTAHDKRQCAVIHYLAELRLGVSTRTNTALA